MSGAAQEAGTLPLVGYLAQDPAEVGGLIRRHLPPNWAFATFSAGKRPEDLQEVSYLVVAGSRLTEADIEAARKLRLVHKVGVGYDEIDIAALDARDIPLAVCPLGSAEAVAEHAVSLALAALKSIPYLDRSVREARRWPKWESRHRIRRLRGRVVGIVGYGRIGRAAAGLFRGLGCEVLVHSRTPPPPDANEDVRFVESLDRLFEMASVVSLHVPLTPATHGLVGRRQMELLGADGLLVNTSRGAVLDQDALLQVLQEGSLGFAALDVLAEEPPPPTLRLLDLPNVTITPHIGGGGLDVLEEKVEFIVRNLADFHEGRGAREIVLRK